MWFRSRLERASVVVAAGGIAVAGCSSSGSRAGGGPPDAQSAALDCGAAARDGGGGAFAYTASCTVSPADAAAPTTCEEWWQDPAGDWTPFIASCEGLGGVISMVRCKGSGLGAACAYAPTCESQTFVFGRVPAGGGACVGDGGA